MSNTVISKQFITPRELDLKSCQLSKIIFDSGIRPTWIVALWRGMSYSWVTHLQEFLDYNGIKTNHIAIRTSSYVGTTQSREIAIHGLHYIIEYANADDVVILVDDIFDSGRTIDAVMNTLKTKMRANTPTASYYNGLCNFL